MSVKTLMCTIIFSAFLCSFQLKSEETNFSNIILAFTIFQGDQYQDFRGDPVAILENGSEWKIHPEDREIFSTWNIGESVHISLRTSHFWFKRDHKFLLINHAKGESVRVMLVKHSNPSLEIIETSEIYSTTVMVVEEYIANDHLGRPIFEEEVVPTGFKKDLFLSDGTVCVIDKNFEFYNQGTPLYIGFKEEEDGIKKFMIAGLEREATWIWLEAKN